MTRLTVPHARHLVCVALALSVTACNSGGSGTLDVTTTLDMSEGDVGVDMSEDDVDATTTSADTSAADTGQDAADTTTATDVGDVTTTADAGDTTVADTSTGDTMVDADVEPGCVSNSQCPAPTNICDTVLGTCVECLVTNDCTVKPGTVCDAGTCACPGANERFCDGACVDIDTSVDHCGRCGSGCVNDGACSAGKCVDKLREMSSVGGPGERYNHVSVWTGEAMFVWGGQDSDNTFLNTGGLYDPITDTWTPTSTAGAPQGRTGTEAVWTGTEVLIWGGQQDVDANLATGAYNPATDTWRPITSVRAPALRSEHGVAWTGAEMIVWGGFDETGFLNDGAAYDPVADTWRDLPSDPARIRRAAVAADWVDGELHVHGGYGDDDNAGQTGIYFGAHRILGRDGTWRDGSAFAPSARAFHTAALVGSTGERWFVWGGEDGATVLDTGRTWNPANEMWSSIATQGAPEARFQPNVVPVRGAVVVVGGGAVLSLAGPGGIWDAASNTWTPLPDVVPISFDGGAVSTGNEAIVWGFGGGMIIEP